MHNGERRITKGHNHNASIVNSTRRLFLVWAPDRVMQRRETCGTVLPLAMADIDDFEGSYDDYGSDFEDESHRNGPNVRCAVVQTGLRLTTTVPSVCFGLAGDASRPAWQAVETGEQGLCVMDVFLP
jgi:hypothetical protein